MALVRYTDLISTVEQFLVDNWPNPDAVFSPGAAASPRPYDGTVSDPETAVDARVRAQWQSYTEQQPVRASEDWNQWELRLIVEAVSIDRLQVAELADDLRDLLQNVNLTILSRADGSTTVGYARVLRAEIQGPGVDSRGVAQAIVEVEGWVKNP